MLRHRITSHFLSAGSVLDFSSLRQRDSDELQQQQQEVLAAHILNKGCNPVPIKTISGTLTPLPPLLQLTECEGLPMRGYNFSARKPSQDSGGWLQGKDQSTFPSHHHHHHHSLIHLHNKGLSHSSPFIYIHISAAYLFQATPTKL